MKYNLVFPGGGARVFSAGAGLIRALELAEVDIDTAGGVSAGYPVALLYKAGYCGNRLAVIAVETVFRKLLRRLLPIHGILHAIVFRRVNERLLPQEAAYGSEGVRVFFDRMVSELPKGCWTLAVHGNYGDEFNLRDYLFAGGEGVFEHRDDGTYHQISDTLPTPGTIAQYSMAIPGIIESLQYQCAKRVLRFFDGMLTPEGRCPIKPILHHYGKDKASIISLDVGDEPPSFMTAVQGAVYRFWCRPCHKEMTVAASKENREVHVVHVHSNIPSLAFGVGQLPKLGDYVDAIVASMRMLIKSKIGNATQKDLEWIIGVREEMRRIEERVDQDRSLWPWQRTRRKVELIKKFLVEKDLYMPAE